MSSMKVFLTQKRTARCIGIDTAEAIAQQRNNVA
jgi:hypothetical protein